MSSLSEWKREKGEKMATDRPSPNWKNRWSDMIHGVKYHIFSFEIELWRQFRRTLHSQKKGYWNFRLPGNLYHPNSFNPKYQSINQLKMIQKQCFIVLTNNISYNTSHSHQESPRESLQNYTFLFFSGGMRVCDNLIRRKKPYNIVYTYRIE